MMEYLGGVKVGKSDLYNFLYGSFLLSSVGTKETEIECLPGRDEFFLKGCGFMKRKGFEIHEGFTILW